MPKKVLVVDDDANTVRFLSVALEQNGYLPVGAADGAEGLAKVEEESPDLILLDVMMPKKTGFVLFKTLRKDERFKGIPVMMLTGVGASLEELDAKAGDTAESPYASLRESLRKKIAEMKDEGLVKPEYFIEKPIDPDEVIAKIRELIGE